jgi:phosphate transport system substrate-binding protein
MSSHQARSGIAFAAILLLAQATLPASAEVKVHGATTVTYGLMKPQQAQIEKISGTKLTILPSSTSRGLTDLAEGKADIAMLAEPVQTAAESLNKKQPGAVKIEEFQDNLVGNAFIQFVVHPSNPVKSLTKAQLAGLFSGQIKNWSEVGGPSQPVLLVGEPTSSPHKMIADALAIQYAPGLRVVQNTNQVAIIVAQAPSAFGYISTAHDIPERDKLKVIESDVKLPLALYLAYRKNASEEVMKVVKAAASVATK